LLEHYPYRYLDSAQVQNIKSIQPHQEYVQLKGILMQIFEEGSGFKRRLKATLADQTGQMELVWFQGIPWIKKNLIPNKAYTVFGKLSVFNGVFSITHPEIEPVENQTLKDVPPLQPVYSTTEKLRSKGLTNRAFAKLLQALMEKLTPSDIPEILPPDMMQQYGLIGRFDALVNIHFPQSETHRQLAERRLKWEELLITQLRIARLRIGHRKQAGWIFEKVGEKFNSFFARHLPFELTGAQKRVLKEIRQDTQTGVQMNRLIQGDVGSGKTMVALMSMLLALDNGFQACLMAPTEILAQQHAQSFRELLKPLHIPVALLTGSVKGKEKKQILEGLQKGLIPFVIGTHALVEDTVQFQNLGLAIIDEQHRFGVTQRAKLWQKNQRPPHILVMTATPIPRTLAMTVYGDLDVSVIDELPPGRKPVQTIHRSENYRPKVMQFIRQEIDKGRQVYIVYPLIDESDKLAYESLNANYEQVKAWFPDHKYNIGMVHGRQPQEERERNMQRFVSGEAHILVATTVIEVGVNVPNATVMVVESAERFGLSQLHQLRGRVGRGADKSYCILLTGYELSQESRRRMSIMVQTTDGFVIAEEDLKMRGPGDLYGTRQSGALNFKIADIIQDVDLMEETKTAAQAILAADPGMEKAMHQPLRVALQQTRSGLVHSWSKIS
jgi:ATP-dependent DNA helicase RecG